MNKLSNHGQSLILFVVFIPFLIMLGVFVIDMGFAKYNVNKLNHLTKMVVRYGLEHIDEDPYYEMVDLIQKNDDDVDNYKIVVEPKEKMVSVSIDKTTKTFFGSIIGRKTLKEKSSYVGKIKDERVIIKEG